MVGHYISDRVGEGLGVEPGWPARCYTPAAESSMPSPPSLHPLRSLLLVLALAPVLAFSAAERAAAAPEGADDAGRSTSRSPPLVRPRGDEALVTIP